jgi:ribosomal protein L37AE/L43A
VSLARVRGTIKTTSWVDTLGGLLAALTQRAPTSPLMTAAQPPIPSGLARPSPSLSQTSSTSLVALLYNLGWLLLSAPPGLGSHPAQSSPRHHLGPLCPTWLQSQARRYQSARPFIVHKEEKRMIRLTPKPLVPVCHKCRGTPLIHLGWIWECPRCGLKITTAAVRRELERGKRASCSE